MERDINSSEDSLIAKYKRSGRTAKILAVVMSIVAAVCIVSTMFFIAKSHEKETEVETLKIQVKNLGGNAEETGNASDGKPQVSPSDTPAVAVSADTDSSKFLYVGVWGVKIAVPDTLTSLSYTYDTAGDTLCVSGVKYREGMQYFPEFANINSNRPGLACVSRVLKDGYSANDAPLEAYDYHVDS